MLCYLSIGEMMIRRINIHTDKRKACAPGWSVKIYRGERKKGGEKALGANEWQNMRLHRVVPPLQPLLCQSEGTGITASAYKHLGNEAPAVLGSNHTDLSISPMHYSPRTAILPPSAPGKDWFHFLFICFSSPPSLSLLLPFRSFSIKLRQARH